MPPGNGADGASGNAPGKGGMVKALRAKIQGKPQAPAAGAPSLDAQFDAAVKDGDWAKAATRLNTHNEGDIRKMLAPLTPANRAELHAAALKDSKLGENSPAALATARIERPILAGGQADRADKAAKKLPPKDKKKYDEMIAKAAPKQKDYLTKGLAAGHTVAELEAFAKKIAGKDDKWLQDNLSLTGNSEGKGVKQQWAMSCNATTVEAVRAEFDPLYALKMHEDNPNLTEADNSDGTKKNKKMAADQKKMLESNYTGSLGNMGGGVAQARDKGGTGRWADDLLNSSSGMTGVKFKTEIVGQGGTTLDKAVTELNESIGKGIPVPIVIGKQGGSSTAHYVLVTATDPGPPRYYTIHDPWEGKTYRRSEDQLKKGKIDIAGWNDLGAIEHPSLTP